MKNVKFNRIYAISLIAIASLFSISAVAAPLALEGPIDSVINHGDGSATITVMGISVFVPADTPISSPTAVLSVDQLADPTPLPGRFGPLPDQLPLPGFTGGTAIITGEATATGNTADDVFVEPAENIIGGVISSDGIGCLSDGCSISGTPMKRLEDSRILAGDPVNPNGLALMTITNGGPAIAEGYFGEDGVFYWFVLETEGELFAAFNSYQISITRARCTHNKEMRVLGGTTAPANGGDELTITGVNYNVTADIFFDTATLESTYSLRDRDVGTCPPEVTTTYVDAQGNSSTVTSIVDIR